MGQNIVGSQQHRTVLGLHTQMIAEGHLLEITEPADKVQIPQAGVGVGGVELANQIGRNHRGRGQIGIDHFGSQCVPIVGNGLLIGVDLHFGGDWRRFFQRRLFVGGQHRGGTQAENQQTDGDGAEHGKPPRETGGLIPA